MQGGVGRVEYTGRKRLVGNFCLFVLWRLGFGYKKKDRKIS